MSQAWDAEQTETSEMLQKLSIFKTVPSILGVLHGVRTTADIANTKHINSCCYSQSYAVKTHSTTCSCDDNNDKDTCNYIQDAAKIDQKIKVVKFMT